MISYDIVVIGASAGGLYALEELLGILRDKIKVPIVIVQHISADSGDSLLKIVKNFSTIRVVEPIDKESIDRNQIYLASPDYHLMVERDKTFSLYMGPKENFCRPAIDLLFETAAEVFLERTIGIILTGANNDGTKGIKSIKDFLGLTIAQSPLEAQVSIMPQSAINSGSIDHILTINEIGNLLIELLKE